MTSDRSVTAEALHGLATDLLGGSGADPEAATIVADSLISASLRGVDSHGIMRLPGYLELIRRGSIKPAARPKLLRETSAIAVFDGDRAFGQIAARMATLTAVEKARGRGIAAAAVSAIQHVGRLGEFGELAASAGFIALMFVNSGPPGGLVAPHGGRARRLGTNPIAFAIPAANHSAIVADFSTASATDGKIRMILNADLPTPEGWLIDADGAPTCRPGDLYDGGALLPMAGHKGFGLGLLVEILGGLLAGEGCASTGDDPGNGFVIVVLDPASFVDTPFGPAVDRVIEAIESCPPADGFDRVMVPGAPETETEATRRGSGIPVSPQTWAALEIETARLGIDIAGVIERSGR